jgi:hypothetical protein
VEADTGAPVPAWNPGANGAVRALATDGQRVYVGGTFTVIDGVARSRLAAVDANSGWLDQNFRADANGEVRSLLLASGKLYSGGLFTTVNGAQRVRLAAVDPVSGRLNTAWRPTASWAVNAMVTVPGTTSIALGGEFSSITGQARRYLAMVDASTGAVRPWAPPADCINSANPCVVRSIAATASLVYAAVSGPGGRLSAYDVTSGVRRWSQYGDGDVQAVALVGGTIYGGGHFGPLFGRQDGANQTRYGLAAMDAVTGRLTPFAPTVTGGYGIWSILAEPEGLRIGGVFTSVNGDTGIRGYAAFPLVPAEPALLGVTLKLPLLS